MMSGTGRKFSKTGKGVESKLRRCLRPSLDYISDRRDHTATFAKKVN